MPIEIEKEIEKIHVLDGYIFSTNDVYTYFF